MTIRALLFDADEVLQYPDPNRNADLELVLGFMPEPVAEFVADVHSAEDTTTRTACRPPNVPPLSSGRISKRKGCRWRRASPWYFTTGEREAAQVATRRGRLLQRLVGQQATPAVIRGRRPNLRYVRWNRRVTT